MEDHTLLPGVEAGDIGPKYGYNSKDNGFMRFNNVKIPRRNMLMKFVEVDKEGNFNLKGDLRILYSTMLFLRVEIVYGAGYVLTVPLAITTRYSVVRR